jgi:hypothetical protein
MAAFTGLCHILSICMLLSWVATFFGQEKIVATDCGLTLMQHKI